MALYDTKLTKLKSLNPKPYCVKRIERDTGHVLVLHRLHPRDAGRPLQAANPSTVGFRGLGL